MDKSMNDQTLALPYEASPVSEITENASPFFKLDALGPMIIGTDGTIQRISNWHELSPDEQTKTFRLICSRNKKRIEALKREEETKEE